MANKFQARELTTFTHVRATAQQMQDVIENGNYNNSALASLCSGLGIEMFAGDSYERDGKMVSTVYLNGESYKALIDLLNQAFAPADAPAATDAEIQS